MLTAVSQEDTEQPPAKLQQGTQQPHSWHTATPCILLHALNASIRARSAALPLRKAAFLLLKKKKLFCYKQPANQTRAEHKSWLHA